MSKGRGGASGGHTQEQRDDYANQNNPNNDAYQDDLDNHADQLSPTSDGDKAAPK